MDQGFSAMTSYPPRPPAEDPARISTPPPRTKTYHQRAGTHNTSMTHDHMLATSNSRNYPPFSSVQHPYPHESGPTTILHDPPRYPESSQRTLYQHHDHDRTHYTYQPAAPAYVDHLDKPQYPSVVDAADAPYLPSFHDPSFPIQHSPSSNYQLPPMTLHLPPEPHEISHYRNSMRTYHDLQSSNNPYRRASIQSSLRLSHSVQHHNTPHDPRLYLEDHPIARISSRHNSITPEPVPASPSQIPQRQHPHQPRHTSLAYGPIASSAGHSTSYPSTSGESHRSSHTTAARATTYSTEFYSAAHASSSIPMSNSHAHPANTNGAHEHRHSMSTHCAPEDGHMQYTYSRDPPTDLHSTPHSAPNLDAFSRHDRYADPRAKSTLDLLRTPFDAQYPASGMSPYHSPLGTSDNDSAMDSDGGAHEDDDHDVSPNAAPKLNSILLDSHCGKRTPTSREDGGWDGAAGDVVDEQPKKKKKKSKMHECGVCGKKFPRPSGLKTHMNTHSNEKPFPCGFPGCARTFGVRSNAKRHLRTHGVVPAASDAQPLYVVGFEPPVVLPPHPEPSDNSGNATDPGSVPGAAGVGGAASEGQGQGGEARVEGRAGEGAGAERAPAPRDHYRYEHQKSVRRYKIKWMPLSLSTRTNAASLREAVEEERREPPPDRTRRGDGREDESRVEEEQDEEEEEEEEEGAEDQRRAGGLRLRTHMEDSESEDMEDGALDHAGGLYSDMAAAARLSFPLRPVFPSSASGMGPSMLDEPTGSNGNLECRCAPKCPSMSSGYSRYQSSSSSSSSSTFGLPSLSSSSSTSAFMTPASSTRVSTSPRSGLHSRSATLDRGKSSLSELGEAAAASTSAPEFSMEERNSYLGFGSHPYHPAQFCMLPGPAPANAVASPRYMVV